MNVLMAGVGGQGIILASDVLSEVMLREGLDIKKSEVHGMAQRGGSVLSHVRFDQKIYSPIIPLEKCDILLAFEELETARYLPYLKADAKVVINKFRLLPPSVIAGKESYPDILPMVKEKANEVYVVEASRVAKENGNIRGMNIVLLGILSQLLDTQESVWTNTLGDMLPKKILQTNITGFLAGRKMNLEKI